MSDDFISSLSQEKLKKNPTENVLFPEIPDPPPGFDPEAEVIYTSNIKHSARAKASKKKVMYTPKAKVYIVGEEGNEEFNTILLRGVSGEVVLGKKEVTDIKGSEKFKVYLEWMEIAAKNKR